MDLKFQVLLFYYLRPRLVKNSLQSLLDSNFQNYELWFIDDSEDKTEGLEAYRWWFSKSRKIGPATGYYYHTQDTIEEKILRGGSNFGMYANKAMEESFADICLMVCDDDFLWPGYLDHLNNYYQENSSIMYSYGHIVLYNPLDERYEDVIKKTEASEYLRHYDPINPYCRVDSSQVSWRRSEAIKNRITFPYPLTSNLDAAIYAKMCDAWGPCVFNGSIAQGKGWFDAQLGKRQKVYGDTE